MSRILQPIKTGMLSVQVFNTLRDAIFAGELLPGDALREAHLARDMQVSQVTVREALVKLEQMGLVVRTPNIGTHVTKLTKQEILERIELRAVLEEMAFIKASGHMEAQHFEELTSIVEKMEQAIKKKDYFGMALFDLDFHRAIWRMSGSKTLYATLDQLAVPLFAFVSLTRKHNAEEPKGAVQRHRDVVNALKSRSIKAIKKVLQEHFEIFYVVPESLR